MRQGHEDSLLSRKCSTGLENCKELYFSPSEKEKITTNSNNTNEQNEQFNIGSNYIQLLLFMFFYYDILSFYSKMYKIQSANVHLLNQASKTTQLFSPLVNIEYEILPCLTDIKKSLVD